jgi:hypothetical protein
MLSRSRTGQDSNLQWISPTSDRSARDRAQGIKVPAYAIPPPGWTTTAVLLLLSVGGCWSQTFPGPGPNSPYPHSGGGGITWTLVQHPSNYTCAGTSGVCTLSGATGQVATTAGDLLVVLSSLYSPLGGPTISGNTLTDSGGTADSFTHFAGTVTGDFNYNTTNWYATDGFYVLSAHGGATSFTFTWSNGGSNVNFDIELLEFRRSTGTATYDTGNFTTNASCTSCTAPALSSFSGANAEVCAQWGGFNQTVSAISGTYTNPADFENTNVGAGFAGSLSVSSYTAPAWTLSSATLSGATMSAACFK